MRALLPRRGWVREVDLLQFLPKRVLVDRDLRLLRLGAERWERDRVDTLGKNVDGSEVERRKGLDRVLTVRRPRELKDEGVSCASGGGRRPSANSIHNNT